MAQPKVNNLQLAGPLFDVARIVRVDKTPKVGSYTSIKTAIESITDATSSSQVAVMVGPGTYTEDPIILPTYVALSGWSVENAVTIVPTNPTNTVITAQSGSSLSKLTISGATGVGGIGLYYTPTLNGPATPLRVGDCQLFGNHTDFKILGNTNTTYVRGHNLYFASASATATRHLDISNPPGGGEMAILFTVTGITNISAFSPPITEAILVAGTNCRVFFDTLSMQTVGGVNCLGDALVIQDGAHVDVIGGAITGYNNNIVTRNVGVAPTLHVSSVLSQNSTIRDLSLEHPGTTGLFTGAADKSKTFVHA